LRRFPERAAYGAYAGKDWRWIARAAVPRPYALLAAHELAMGGSPSRAGNASLLGILRSKASGPRSFREPYAEPVELELLMAEAAVRYRSVARRLKAGPELLVV
jgi:hypothetical protein